MKKQLTYKEDILLFFAFRYSLGRCSMAPCIVSDYIIEDKKRIKSKWLKKMIKEIKEAIEDKVAGWEMDEKMWDNLSNILKQELKERDK